MWPSNLQPVKRTGSDDTELMSVSPINKAPTVELTDDSHHKSFSFDGAPSLDGGDTKRIEYSLYCKCAAEFLCVLTFTLAGSLQAAGGSVDGVLHGSLTHGFVLVILCTTFGSISGAHVNPAVTLGITLVKKLPPIECVAYIISQLAGSFIAALLTRAISTYSSYVATQGGATVLSLEYEWYQGLIAEICATFFLVTVVLNAAVDQSNNILAPLAIGLTVAADVLAIGNITGGSMNPGRSFGPNIVGSIFIKTVDRSPAFWDYHWIYYVGPCVGSFLSAITYRLFFAQESRVCD